MTGVLNNRILIAYLALNGGDGSVQSLDHGSNTDSFVLQNTISLKTHVLLRGGEGCNC